jgi:hypothetical protein
MIIASLATSKRKEKENPATTDPSPTAISETTHRISNKATHLRLLALPLSLAICEIRQQVILKRISVPIKFLLPFQVLSLIFWYFVL